MLDGEVVQEQEQEQEKAKDKDDEKQRQAQIHMMAQLDLDRGNTNPWCGNYCQCEAPRHSPVSQRMPVPCVALVLLRWHAGLWRTCGHARS